MVIGEYRIILRKWPSLQGEAVILQNKCDTTFNIWFMFLPKWSILSRNIENESCGKYEILESSNAFGLIWHIQEPITRHVHLKEIRI